MAHSNVLTAHFETDPDDPAGFLGSCARISSALGARELIVKAMLIEPGNHLCPYHYEYVEEWLLVLSGSVDVRMPAETIRLGDGDIICFPSGPEGAHRVSCPAEADGPARVVMFSADADPSVCVYPDSDKLAVYNRRVPEDELFVRRAAPSSHLDYFDGESA